MTDLGIKTLEFARDLGPLVFLICVGVIAMLIGVAAMIYISKLFVGHMQSTTENHEKRIDRKDTEHREYVDQIAKSYEQRIERKDQAHSEERKEWREDISKSMDRLANAIESQKTFTRRSDAA